jgi:thiamine biosynthesis lipoprotein
MTAHRHIEHCMGTVFSFDIREPGVDDAVLDKAVALLHDIDATFSTYRNDSVISRLARGDVVLKDTSADVQYVLAECALWQQQTDGWFSPYATRVLDPSGYVKGWAIQLVSDLLRDEGSTSHCINGGGDIQCMGTTPIGEPWRVGISDPLDRARVVTIVAGTDLAVATSGSAERGTHILDPHTGRPPSRPLLSLTISGRSIVECDVFSTAGFAMGAAARDWLTGLHDVRAFAVEADGATWSTFSTA